MDKALDLVIAGVIFVTATAVSVFAYASILDLETPDHVIADKLVVGPNWLAIKSASGCAGTFETLLAHDKAFEIITSGHIAGKLNGNVTTANFNANAYFNPLGQMSDSSLAISANGISLKISTKEINPIKLTFNATLFDKSYGSEFTLPGPVLIKKIGRHFRIESPSLAPTQNSLISGTISTLSETLNLDLIRSETNLPECANNMRLPIELTPLVTKLRAVVGGWNSLAHGVYKD